MVDENLDWDSVLQQVEHEEKENPSLGPGDFEPLPNGPYNVVVQEASKEVSKSGNDMIKTRVQVTEGPYANRVLFSYIVFSKGNPKAMRMTLERLSAFGITREIIATTKPSIPQIAEMMVGRRAVAVVSTQTEGEYAGRNEIKSFRAPKDAQPAPAAPAAAPAPGIPNIPAPAPAAAAPAPAAPSIPVPEVPAGDASENPFG